MDIMGGSSYEASGHNYPNQQSIQDNATANRPGPPGRPYYPGYQGMMP